MNIIMNMINRARIYMHLKSVKYDANMQRKSAYICNYMHYVTLYKILFKKNHTFISNKILNILSKTKKNDNIH
jgi:hypothetical protein